ncbi:MAG: outer membrane protein assembly factor BamE [Candidatus Omnitrophota bacterium]|nr:outer membrane protein assembly factor BamE [Candidatus Omnitrophota bacterium]
MRNIILISIIKVCAIILLFMALAGHHHGDFFFFLRVTIFLISIGCAAWSLYQKHPVWIGLFAVIAILFNPIIPCYLDRSLWKLLDIASAAIFAASILSDLHLERKDNDEEGGYFMKSISDKWKIICSIIAGITILGIYYMFFILAPQRQHEAEQRREQFRLAEQQLLNAYQQSQVELAQKQAELAQKHKQESELAEQKREREYQKAKQESELASKERESKRQESVRNAEDDRQKREQERLAKEQRQKQNEQIQKQNELAKWKQLKIGMTKSQVEKILGKPESLDTVDYLKLERWKYATPAGFYGGGRVEFKDGKLSSWDAP